MPRGKAFTEKEAQVGQKRVLYPGTDTGTAKGSGPEYLGIHDSPSASVNESSVSFERDSKRSKLQHTVISANNNNQDPLTNTISNNKKKVADLVALAKAKSTKPKEKESKEFTLKKGREEALRQLEEVRQQQSLEKPPSVKAKLNKNVSS